MTESDQIPASSPQEDPGVILMLAFQKGDDAAFEELVLAHQGAAFAMLRRILGPHAMIEDLAQEAFLRVWRARERYKPAGKFTTFLYRITYNLALNRVRDDKRKAMYSLPKNADGVEMPQHDLKTVGPDEEVDGGDWAQIVRRCLSELPENQRVALVFQHYDGLELHEIADIIGSSPKAVKSLLHRARANLRTLLTPYREAEND
ncbi:MAG: RNA polymerase sigma factor [Planctomycetes bacterium]|nr:RNA polymerase sigma factor [Planctomycetota bacterium]MCP4769795.1 RNA polymerase sigma factor [Planctomycetota bacterium]MCP4859635.1 RNA polymerase sigma factor [Planctomycetota bacterium]